MNTPSQNIIDKAIAQVKTSFTKEVIENSVYCANNNHFVISVVNVRGGFQTLVDYTFTKKTGKIVKSEVVETKPSAI